MERQTTAIGYIRVSTAEQASEGVSLEAQRGRIEAWATANGFRLAEVHADAGISGTKADRPGLQRAIEDVCRGGGALVVYSLSRLARSTRQTLEIAERIDKAGADLVSLSERIDTTSAAGKMLFRMLAVLAEFERDQIAERTKTALKHIRQSGRKTGGDVPFGWTAGADGLLQRNPTEWPTVEAIRRLRADGRTLRSIASELEGQGMRPRNGSRWNPTQIDRIAKAG